MWVAPVSSLTLFLEGAGLVIAGLVVRAFFSGSLGHGRRVHSVSDLLIAHYDIGALGVSARGRRPSPVYAAGFALLFTALQPWRQLAPAPRHPAVTRPTSG